MIYGDLCDHNISKLIKMVDRFKIFPLIAGGNAEIQPVNARDLGKAYFLVLNNKERTKNKCYNLSGADKVKIREMLEMIKKEINSKNFFIPIPMWISISTAYIIKIVSFGKINIVEKVLRMNETRTFTYKEAADDFGYTPSSFKEGLKNEIGEYLRKKDEKNSNCGNSN